MRSRQSSRLPSIHSHVSKNVLLDDAELMNNAEMAWSLCNNFCCEFFAGKILWAPLVDSVYVSSFGRRKSWLIPAQILIGFFMLFLSQFINDWMGDGAEQKPQMIRLTIVFFMLWMLTATQDIAVDGWALKMRKRN